MKFIVHHLKKKRHFTNYTTGLLKLLRCSKCVDIPAVMKIRKLNELGQIMTKKENTQAEETVEPKDNNMEETAETTEETAAKDVGEETSEEAKEEKAEEKTVEKTPEEQLAEMKDSFLRKIAEFDNFRKRKAKDVQDARFQATCNVIETFLTVYDHFKMAMKSVENGDSLEIVQQGMQMILSEFGRTFENLGVNEVTAVGEKFDPTLHDAISEQSSEDVEEGYVVQEWKSGYKLNDRLLRPAVVVVSSGPEKTENESDEETPAEQPEKDTEVKKGNH